MENLMPSSIFQLSNRVENDDDDLPDNESSVDEGNSYVFTYLGFSQLLTNSTGFGSVQKALTELYFSFLFNPGVVHHKRTITLGADGLTTKQWDPGSSRFQLEFFPYMSVTYVDSLQFDLVHAPKKKIYGFFRRYLPDEGERGGGGSDNSSAPLIPLGKRDTFITGVHHRPLVACILRRPQGIKFLDCHVYLAETKTEAQTFSSDLKTRTSRAQFNHAVGHDLPTTRPPRVWKSQPCLLTSSPWVPRTAEDTVRGRHSNFPVSPSMPLHPCPSSSVSLVEDEQRATLLNNKNNNNPRSLTKVSRAKSMASLFQRHTGGDDDSCPTLSVDRPRRNNSVFNLIQKFETVTRRRNPSTVQLDSDTSPQQHHYYARPTPFTSSTLSQLSQGERKEQIMSYTSPRRVKQKSKEKRSAISAATSSRA